MTGHSSRALSAPGDRKPTPEQDQAVPDSESPERFDPKEYTVLLSRVAESVYWSARYLERAEATARLIKVHTEMFLDLPLDAGIGWSPLLAVTGSREEFDDHHDHADEDTVIRFLAIEPTSTSSILTSISSARANFRVTRAIFPNSSWEELNQLFLWIVQSRALAVDRKKIAQFRAENRLTALSGYLAQCLYGK